MTAAGVVLVGEKEPPSRSPKPSGNERNRDQHLPPSWLHWGTTCCLGSPEGVCPSAHLKPATPAARKASQPAKGGRPLWGKHRGLEFLSPSALPWATLPSHTSPQNIRVLVLRGGHGALSSQFPSGLMFFGGLLLGESVSDVGATPEPTPSASSLTSYTSSFTPLTRRNSKSPPISCSVVTPKAFLRTLRAWAVEKADDSDLSSANWITVGNHLPLSLSFSSLKW